MEQSTFYTKNQLDQAKQPFLNNVNQSKQNIKQKREQFCKYMEQLKQNEQLLLSQCITNNLIRNSFSTNRMSYQTQDSQQLKSGVSQHNDIDSDDDKQYKRMQKKEVEQKAGNVFKEWKGRNKERAFQNHIKMAELYEKVFNKKTGSTSPVIGNFSSQKNLQRQMIRNIFHQYKTEQSYISLQAAVKFFQDCSLFLTIYEIKPFEIKQLVRCSAFTVSDKLSQQQFIEMISSFNPDKVQETNEKLEKVFCLNKLQWQELRRVFDKLDTFGDDCIQMGQFIHHMRHNQGCRQLYEANVLYYQQLDKYYDFQKILFDIQHKTEFQRKLSWQQLKDTLINFQHIEYPTVNQIYTQSVSDAHIDKYSNLFLLDDKIIQLLIKTFQRCPRVKEKFINKQHFYQEIRLNQEFKPFMNEIVRKNSQQLISVQQNLKLLSKFGPKFMDLDQMLNFFSIKGFQKDIQKLKSKQIFQSSEDQEDQFQEQKKAVASSKRAKSINNMSKIMKDAKYFSIEKHRKRAQFYPTNFEQFNLTNKRSKLTIRQKNLKKMIEQKELKQVEQLRPFVKANSIPASSTCQMYLAKQQKFRNNLQLQHYRRAVRREKDDILLRYLEANTKLFKKRDIQKKVDAQKQVAHEDDSMQWLLPNQVPWFVKQKNLLGQIQEGKEQRRKKILKQTQQKYKQHWKKLSPRQIQLANMAHKEDDINDLQRTASRKSLVDQQSLERQSFATPIPDYKKLQQKFQRELQLKKRARSPTVVKEFNFSQPKPTRTAGTKDSKDTAGNEHSKVYKANPAPSTERNVIIKSTKKFEQMVQLNQDRQRIKQYQQQIKIQQEEQRRRQKKVFAKYMKQALKQNSAAKKKNSNSSKTGKRTNSSISHEQQLKCIYQRVLQRPFLCQQQLANISSKKDVDKLVSHKRNAKLKNKRVLKSLNEIGKIQLPVNSEQMIEQQSEYEQNQESMQTD